MYAYYVRNMYLENNLRVPGKLTMCGVPVDLSKIDVPAFLLASREDHIVPWKTAYESTRLLGGRHRIRAGRKRSYRRRHQSGCQKQPALLAQSGGVRDARRLARGRAATPGQLVDALERLARRTWRRATCRAQRSRAMRIIRAIEAAPGRYVKAALRLIKPRARLRDNLNEYLLEEKTNGTE